MAHAGQVLFLLGGVPGTIAAGLGQAVHLGNKEALVHQVLEHLGVEHGCAAGQDAQAIQAVAAALHHIFIQALQQHRHHSHHLAVHRADIAVEILEVVAQVDAVAGNAPGYQAGHGRDVEHGQRGQRAELIGVPAGRLAHIIKRIQEGGHGRKQVLLAQHNALAAAGGTGGKHDKGHRGKIFHFLYILCGGKGGKGIHRLQLCTVGIRQSRLPLQILTVLQHTDRLHQIQLVLDLVPVLAHIQRHCHTARQHGAVHTDDVVVTVAGQDRDPLPLDIPCLTAQEADEPAQILGILAVVHLRYALFCLVIIPDRHVVRIDRFHITK